MVGLLMLLGVALALLLTLLTAMMAWEMAHPKRRTAAWAVARGLPSDPGDLRLTCEEWWLDRPDGARLPVWEIQTDRGSASGLTAVFIHGWGHSRISSLQRVRPFVPLVDRLILYDLRGSGEATGGPSRLGDGEDDDLLALLERLGHGRFILVGHSMGAVIALRAAAKSSDQRSVLSDEHPSVPGAARGSMAQHPIIAGIIAYGAYCEFHRSLQGRLHVHGLPARPLTDLALLVHRLRGVRPASLDPGLLRNVHIPLLVVQGVHDQVAPLEHARRIAQRAPDALLIEVNDAAHADSHSVDEPSHDEAVRGFIERVRLRTSGLVA